MPIVPEDSVELHVPGFQFLGPGTHIIDRINNRTTPLDRTDFVAMLHDITYLMGSGDYRWTAKADKQAISDASISLSGIILKMGLTMRQILDLKFNPYTPNSKVASSLMYIAKNDPIYAELFKLYRINPADYPDEY